MTVVCSKITILCSKMTDFLCSKMTDFSVFQNDRFSVFQNDRSTVQSREGDTEMTSAEDSRITALEQQIMQLQLNQQGLAHQHQVLEAKVDHFGGQFETQKQKLQSHMDDRLADQFSRIEALLSKRPRQE